MWYSYVWLYHKLKMWMRTIILYVAFYHSMYAVLWSPPCAGSAIPSQQVWSWSILCSTRLHWCTQIPLPNPYPNSCLEQSIIALSKCPLSCKCPPFLQFCVVLKGPLCNCPPCKIVYRKEHSNALQMPWKLGHSLTDVYKLSVASQLASA